MWSNYRQKSLLAAVQSGKGHICFTEPFLLKMDCKISGWRFFKFWFFNAGFYCITSLPLLYGNLATISTETYLHDFVT